MSKPTFESKLKCESLPVCLDGCGPRRSAAPATTPAIRRVWRHEWRRQTQSNSSGATMTIATVTIAMTVTSAILRVEERRRQEIVWHRRCCWHWRWRRLPAVEVVGVQQAHLGRGELRSLGRAPAVMLALALALRRT